MGAFLMHKQATCIHELTRLTTAWTWGKPPPSPLYYFLWLITELDPNVIFPKTPKLRVPKFSKLVLLPLWRPITSCVNLQFMWGLKQSCSSNRKISNDMWHTICMHIIQSNSWLLVVGSQIDTFTLKFFSTITCVVNTQIDHASPF
jgi:hypothetical protein